jgi:hypothetical protein
VAVIELRVGKNGSPQDGKAVRADGGTLAGATLDAVKGWQFEPGTVDGKPAESHGEVELTCRAAGKLFAPSVYHVGGGVAAPVLLSKVEPEYSEQARQAKLQGDNCA